MNKAIKSAELKPAVTTGPLTSSRKIFVTPDEAPDLRVPVREIDLIVGRFADAHIASLDAAALDDFERLIEAPNAELYAWVVGSEKAPAGFDTTVLAKLRAFHMGTPTMRAGEER